MSIENLQQVYEAVAQRYSGLGDFETFKRRMRHPENERHFYDFFNPKLRFGTFEEFQQRISTKRAPIAEILAGVPSSVGSSIEASGKAADTLGLPGASYAIGLGQDIQDPFTRTRDDIFGTARGGFESALTSIELGIPGALIAGAAGGGPIAGVVGFASAPSLIFSLAEYYDFMEDLKASLVDQGITDPEVIDKVKRDPEVRNAALLAAAAEGGFEFLSNLIQAKILGIGQLVKKTGKGIVREPLKKGLTETVKRVTAKWVGSAAVELPTEAATAAVQVSARELAGIPVGVTPGEAAKSVLGEAAFAAFFFAGFGEARARILEGRDPMPTGDFLKAVKEVLGEGVEPKVSPRKVEVSKYGATYGVGDLIVTAADPNRPLEIIAIKEGRIYSLDKNRREPTSHNFSINALQISRYDGPISLNRESFRSKMLLHPDITEEQVDLGMLVLDARASTLGISTDELIGGWFKEISVGGRIGGDIGSPLVEAPKEGVEGLQLLQTGADARLGIKERLRKVRESIEKRAKEREKGEAEIEEVKETKTGIRKGLKPGVLPKAIPKVGDVVKGKIIYDPDKPLPLELEKLVVAGVETYMKRIDIEEVKKNIYFREGNWYLTDKSGNIADVFSETSYDLESGSILRLVSKNDIDRVLDIFIRRKLGINMGSGGGIPFQSIDDKRKYQTSGPIFFSPMQKAIEEFPDWGKKESVGTGHLRGWLTKQGQSVNREIKWNGFGEWLGGRVRVTKDDVRKWVAANQLELTRVVSLSEEQENRIIELATKSKLNIKEGREELTNQEIQEYNTLISIKPTEHQRAVLPGPHTNFRNIFFVAPQSRPVWTPDPDHKFAPNNTVGWVLFDTRIDKEGDKILFVEELQSKWAQQNRAEMETVKQKITSYKLQIEQLLELGKLGTEKIEILEAEIALWEKYIIKELIRGEGLPGKGFVENWHELVMRGVLQYAAERGFDKVGWATGELMRDVRNYRPREGQAVETHWTTNLYDKIVPLYMKKYVKGFGGEVGSSEIFGRDSEVFKVHSVKITPEMKAPISKFQEVNGITDFKKDGKAIVRLLETANFSTMMHEFWHVFEHNLTPLEQEAYDSIFGDDLTGEHAARAFERYLRDGKTPNTTLKEAFRKFREWLVAIYKSILGSPLDVKFTPEMTAFFDSLLIGEVVDTGKQMRLDSLDVPVIGGERDPETFFMQTAKEAEGFEKQEPGVFGRKKATDWIVKKLSIVDYWTRMGAPNVGEAIRAAESTRDVIAEVWKREGRDIKKKHPKAIEGALIALAAEDDRFFDRLDGVVQDKLKEKIQTVRKMWEDALADLIDRKILVRGFYEGLREKISNELDKASKYNDIDRVTVLEQELKDLEGSHFVSIPAMVYFESLRSRDPDKARRLLLYNARRRRKTRHIADLLLAVDEKGNPIIGLEDVDIVEILAHYGRRYGRDVAVSNVVLAAVQDGVARYIGNPDNPGVAAKIQKIIGEGIFTHPPRTALAFRGFVIKPIVRDWIDERMFYEGRGTWLEKTISWTKMAQFTNPFFLGMYDMVQHTMRFGPNVFRAFKYLRIARKHILNQTEEFKSFHTNAGSSKPYASPYESFQDDINRMKKGFLFYNVLEVFDLATLKMGLSEAPGRLVEYVKRSTDFKANKLAPIATLLKTAYTISWNTAWQLDELVRVATYLRLRDKGMSQQSSAQMTATFHGDYANVPASTRRFLNYFLFTPTFKIAMGRLYYKQLEGAIKTSLGKGGENERGYAMGLIWTLGIIAAFDLAMKGLGWEPEEFGYKYKRIVEDEEGNTKELIWSFSNPANLWLKFLHRARVAFGEQQLRPAALDFALRNKWEIHPLWRISTEVLTNKSSQGNEIYSPFDDPATQFGKSLLYWSTHIIRMLGIIVEEGGKIALGVPPLGESLGIEDEEARKLFGKEVKELFGSEVGKTIEVVSKPFTFKYLRSSKNKRAAFEIYELKNQFRKAARKKAPTPKEFVRFQAKIEKALEKIEF